MPESHVDDRVRQVMLEDEVVNLFLLVAQLHNATARANGGPSARDEAFDAHSCSSFDQVALRQLRCRIYGGDNGIETLQGLDEGSHVRS